MALTWRNGRPYFYRSTRVGARVTRLYVAAGAEALALATQRARLDAAESVRTAQDADRRRRLAGVRMWIVDANTFAAGAMRAAGWHQHRREWQRKRGVPMATPVRDRTGTTPADAELLAVAGQPPPATRADGSDPAGLAAVDEYLSHPAAVALWGDFGRHVLQQWVNVFAGHDAVRERAMLRFASELRTRLAGPRPDALTTLLAERVVLAWVFAN